MSSHTTTYSPQEGNDNKVSSNNNKKTKHDLLGMLDDHLLSVIFVFASGDAKDLVQIQRTNKRCRDLLQDDSPLLMQIRQCLLLGNADYGPELENKWVRVTLESIGFYQAVFQEGIFDTQAFRVKGSQRHAVPQAALRVRKLFQIMEKFPRCKASWENASFSLSDCDAVHNPLGISDGSGMISVVIHVLIGKGIILNPSTADIEVPEHINIHMYGARQEYQHPIYQEYMREVPANLFQGHACMHCWANVPLHLKYLILCDKSPPISRFDIELVLNSTG